MPLRFPLRSRCDAGGMSPGALQAATAPFPIVAPYRVVPNLRPLGGAPHVVLDDAWPRLLARRLERLLAEPGRVRVRDPADRDDVGLAAALRAGLALVAHDAPTAVDVEGADIALHHLGVRLRDGTRAEADGTGWPVLGPLPAAAGTHLRGLRGVALLADALALGCPDDIAVLRRRGSGRLAVEHLGMCFPSSWAPAERAGADHLALHGPVGDNRRLLTAAAALSEALLTKGPFVQHAWGIATDDRPDHDPGGAAGDMRRPDTAWLAEGGDLLDRLWLRVERQTSLPLPPLGRALFTIRLHLTPLRAVARDPARAAVLAEALATMRPGTVAYKGLEALRDPLVAALRAAARAPRPTPRG